MPLRKARLTNDGTLLGTRVRNICFSHPRDRIGLDLPPARMATGRG